MTKEINHSDRAHAKLSPSAMDRIIKCPGSVIMCEGIEEVESEYAAEGTLAHEIAEMYGRAFLEGDDTLKCLDAFDSDMIHYAQGYAEFLKKICDKFKPTKEPLFETRVHFSEDIWGTVDFMAVKKLPSGEFDLLVVDYKYGRGVEVSPEDNSQLKTYVAAACKGLNGRLRKAYAYIYQPRVGEKPYKRAVYTGEDIDSWAVTLMDIESIVPLVAESPYNYLNAEGLTHCRFCKYKPKCKAFYDETRGKALIEIEPEPKIPDVESLSIEQRVQILSVKKQIETYLKDVEHSLLTEAMEGADLPGYKVVSGRASRKWCDNEKKVVAKLRRLGVRSPHKKSLIGIGEAEKLIDGSKTEVGKKLANITVKPPGKLQLAKEDDKREAVTFSSREDLIADIEIE